MELNLTKSVYEMLCKKYPTFNIDRLKELYDNPTISLDYGDDGEIVYDPIVVKKYVAMVIDMICYNRDALVINYGADPEVRNITSLRDAYLVNWILVQVGIINEENEKIYSNIENLMQALDEYKDDAYRIFIYNADKLNTENSEDIKCLYQKLRRERIRQRILFINLNEIKDFQIDILFSRGRFLFALDYDSHSGLCTHRLFELRNVVMAESIYDSINKSSDIPESLCACKFESLI